MSTIFTLKHKSLPSLPGAMTAPIPDHEPVKNEKGQIHYETVNGHRKRVHGVRANDGVLYHTGNIGDLGKIIDEHRVHLIDAYNHRKNMSLLKEEVNQLPENKEKYESLQHYKKVMEEIKMKRSMRQIAEDTDPQRRQEMSRAIDEDRKIMQNPVESFGDTSGGIFETSHIKIEDDGEAIAKNEGPEHEVAASVIDQMLGWNLVPPTTGKRWGGVRHSIQRWVDGKTKRESNANEDLAITQWDNRRLHVFDDIINNDDRHFGNIMITPDKRLKAIDNHMAFEAYFNNPNDPLVSDGIDKHSMILDYRNPFPSRLKTLDQADTIEGPLRKDIERVLDNWSDISGKLSGLLTKSSLTAMKIRMELLCGRKTMMSPEPLEMYLQWVKKHQGRQDEYSRKQAQIAADEEEERKEKILKQKREKYWADNPR